MPFPLTFPDEPFPSRVRVRRRTVVAAPESPFTLEQRIYQHPGKRWEIEVTMDPMPRALAVAWTQFFFDLEGRAGTFTFDLDPHCPDLNPAPGTKTFRLADPDVGWDSDLAVLFGFSFRAVEDL